MYAYIQGKLAHASATQVILDVQGIGYQIQIPASAVGKLPILHSSLLLYTSYVVREQSQTLYGFHSIQERDLFEMLIGVTGVGPKLALAIIGHLSVANLQLAVQNEDLGVLKRVPGIGKKSAERLIIELRDKLSGFTLSHLEDSAVPGIHHTVRDAMGALVNLGYTQVAAQKAVKKTLEERSENIDLASLITYSLQHVGN
jgi:Holliday junction DNA helicase RuvA